MYIVIYRFFGTQLSCDKIAEMVPQLAHWHCVLFSNNVKIQSNLWDTSMLAKIGRQEQLICFANLSQFESESTTKYLSWE
jgi:hypothetical protein